MLVAATGLNAAQIVLRYDQAIAPEAQEKLLGYLDRRARREPLQHILGEQFFMGLRFKVGPAVLIPRPETEILVGLAVQLIGEKFDGQARILDIGAGSGAICLSVLKFCQASTAMALEISPDAASLCRTNAFDLGVADRLILKTADFIAEAEQLAILTDNQKFDLFVSNPPYIQKDLFDGLDPEVKNYEPRLALLGLDDDGLGFYRAFARHLPILAAGTGRIILAEFGQGQGPEIKDIFEQANWQGATLLPDLSGRPRMLMAICPA
jgi:release factor glutamine methyltransferase